MKAILDSQPSLSTIAVCGLLKLFGELHESQLSVPYSTITRQTQSLTTMRSRIPIMKVISLFLFVIHSVTLLQARSITFSFEARVETIDDYLKVFEGRLKPGDLITAKYTFDSDEENSNSPEYAVYEFDIPKHGMTVNLANVSLETDPSSRFYIQVFNDLTDYEGTIADDEYWAISESNLSSEVKLSGLTVYINGWDTSARMLSSPALPVKFPDLKAFDSCKLWLSNGSLGLTAKITKVATDDSLFIPFIRILPDSGDFLNTQRIDPVIRIDGVKPDDVKIEKILLDDSDVTTRYLDAAVSGHLADNNLAAIWQLARPMPSPGVHEFKVKVRFPGGRASWSQVKWNILEGALGRGKTRIEEKRRPRVSGKP